MIDLFPSWGGFFLLIIRYLVENDNVFRYNESINKKEEDYMEKIPKS